MSEQVDWKSVITFDPEKCGGRPCVRNMRIRVIDVLELLAANLSVDQIIEELPDLSREDISACLKYSVARMDHPLVKVA